MKKLNFNEIDVTYLIDVLQCAEEFQQDNIDITFKGLLYDKFDIILVDKENKKYKIDSIEDGLIPKEIT